eukprot:1161542-Pelagomonas_calceolata.AAC.5
MQAQLVVVRESSCRFANTLTVCKAWMQERSGAGKHAHSEPAGHAGGRTHKVSDRSDTCFATSRCGSSQNSSAV